MSADGANAEAEGEKKEHDNRNRNARHWWNATKRRSDNNVSHNTIFAGTEMTVD